MDFLLSVVSDQVDEIMMTLKQAFTVAAVQQTAKAPAQLCEGCPLQGLHKLCEQIEGRNSSKTKLELQKHLTTLTNQEQATIFEEVQVQYWFLMLSGASGVLVWFWKNSFLLRKKRDLRTHSVTVRR